MGSDATLEHYFREAASWDADRSKQQRRSVRLAWGLAVAGWLSAIASAVALAALTPLKTVQPFVVRVDNSTGIVDVVPSYAGTADMGETVTRYLLGRYVRVCESFAFASAESDYEECGAFHTAQRNQEWYALWNSANPDSPLNRYKDGTTVRVRVESISFFKRGNGVKDLAQVRYVTAKRSGGTGAEAIAHWIATVQYTYAAPSDNPRTRQWNPLGMRIVDFHREPEVAEPTATTSFAGVAGAGP